MNNNTKYLIIPIEELENVDFNQVMQNSKETCRVSIDGSKAILKYITRVEDQDISYTVENPETGSSETYEVLAGVYGRPNVYKDSYPEYTHSEILEVVSGEEWSSPEDVEN
jgi:hypothetical protein